ncbi:MAG: sensor histidine kinase [Nitrospinota bacterium]|nr:sensor histidine kinase [Nitrospinota bacterium]MDH5790401.1 sensor histidine kinase [Nitrospinota bacterium]
MKKNFKIISISGWTYLLMALMGLFIAGTLAYSYNKAVRMNALYAPLINASVEVELDVTMAHLLVEEILNGDHFEEAQVWENYSRADWYIQAMLKGGQKGENSILPLEDDGLRFIVEDLSKRLREFKNISKTRLEKKNESGPGSDIDQKYNEIFAVFLKEAKTVKQTLQHVMTQDLHRFRLTQLALVATSIFLTLAVGITLYRLERLRATDFQRLKETYDNLENEMEKGLRVVRELEDSQLQLRKLSHSLQSIREDEKTRIAREVHDELGQMLTALKMELFCFEKDLQSNPGCLNEKVESMGGLIDTTINSVRRIATELRPQILDVCGLVDAIKWQARDYQNRTGIRCKLNLAESEVKLNKNLSTSLFRIFQEALTNVARHAKATEIEIALQFEPDDLIMTIQDNGIGIDPEQLHNSDSLGLLGIRERINFWKGRLIINGEPHTGTTLKTYIPLHLYEPI